MKLHRITGRAGKCGPAAIAAVLGIPSHDAAAAVREFSGRKQVHGVTPGELAGALRELAGEAVRRELSPRNGQGAPTLAAWLRDAEPGTYAVCSRRHWIAVAVVDGPRRAGEWADSRNRVPRPLGSAPLRMRLTDAIRTDSRGNFR